MKCIVLLTFVALCYSYPYGSGDGSRYGYGSGSGSGRNIYINQDGSISISAADGRRFSISRGPQQNADVAVTGYERYNRNFWYQPRQADALADILTQYQGDGNQGSFQRLLEDVRSAVQARQLDNNVYEALQNINQAQNQNQRGQIRFGRIPLQNQADLSDALQELRQAQQVQQLIQQERVQQLLQQQEQNQQFQQNQFSVRRKSGDQNAQNEQQYQASGYFGLGNQGEFEQQRGGARRSWGAMITDLINGNAQQSGRQWQYNRYGRQFGQYGSDRLAQIAEKEREILAQQDQIQRQQLQEQEQQQLILQQQLQQQNQQQYIEELQQEVQQEEEQVLNQQQRLQQQQQQQQQQQRQLQQQQQQIQQQQQQQRQQEQQQQQLFQQQRQYNALRNILAGARAFIQNRGQQGGFWQQQPGVYSQGGLYGAYGFQRQNVPLVF